MKALVTGGAGFVGSNLVRLLIDSGHAVTILDDLSTGRFETITRCLKDGAAFVKGVVRDPDAVK